MAKLKYAVRIIFIIYLFNSLPLFPAHKVNRMIRIHYDTIDGIAVNNTFSGNYGIAAFYMISVDEVALLCNVEKKIKIVNTKSGRLVSDFRINSILEDFTFGDSTFFILSDYNILRYSMDGRQLTEFTISKEFKFVRKLHFVENNLYILTSNGNSYKVFDKGVPIDPDEQIMESIPGWIVARGISMNTVKLNYSEFLVNIFL